MGKISHDFVTMSQMVMSHVIVTIYHMMEIT